MHQCRDILFPRRFIKVTRGPRKFLPGHIGKHSTGEGKHSTGKGNHSTDGGKHSADEGKHSTGRKALDNSNGEDDDDEFHHFFVFL